MQKLDLCSQISSQSHDRTMVCDNFFFFFCQRNDMRTERGNKFPSRLVGAGKENRTMLYRDRSPNMSNVSRETSERRVERPFEDHTRRGMRGPRECWGRAQDAQRCLAGVSPAIRPRGLTMCVRCDGGLDLRWTYRDRRLDNQHAMYRSGRDSGVGGENFLRTNTGDQSPR